MQKIDKLVRENHRMSVGVLANFSESNKERLPEKSARTPKERLCQNLHESFNKHKVFAIMVPKLLTPKQKESRMDTCADLLNNTDYDPKLLDSDYL